MRPGPAGSKVSQVSMVVVGAGSCGARHAAARGIADAVAVADWRELAARERTADAVLVSTLDAVHFYGGRLASGDHGWPLAVVVDDPAQVDLDRALRTVPYGRCVFACDNDVVDRQVIAMPC